MGIPQFVRGLRERVGTDLLWLPGVSAAVLDDSRGWDDARVLLVRRADNGLWSIPGGILEPGEQPAVGLAREVLEETGVAVDVLALTSAVSGDVITHANGDLAQYVVLGFWCRAVAGEARVGDDESTDVGWFPVDGEGAVAAPGPVSPGAADRLAQAVRFARAAGGRPPEPQPFLVR